ncbi:MAG: hypothetical protein J6B48_07805 [Clostridia bacterium]|nr:hypothetical protein [Clostridia bacterium]
MTKATIENYNGAPAIIINGIPYSSMMGTVSTYDRVKKEKILDEEYYKRLGESGIKIFFVMCDTEWTLENAFDGFKTEAEAILRAVPDAYLVLRVGIHPPLEWCEKNPGEMLKYSDGKDKPIRLFAGSIDREYPNMYSLCSEKWRADASEALTSMYERVKALPYSDRIIGFFFSAGGTSEWYYVTPMEYTKKTRYTDTGGFLHSSDIEYSDVYGDLSPAFKREFSKYLRAKYKTEEKLKEAWSDDDATFDDPKIPDCEKRYYVDGVDYDIDRPPYVKPADNKPNPPSNGTNIGHFIDLKKHTDVFDFYRALHLGTANSVIHFGNIIKDLSSGNMLTGAFYGSAGATHYFDYSQIGGVHKILTSGAIDFLASPGVYENRQPGGFTGQRQCFDSFALNNRIFIAEDDTRTHHENAYFRNYYEVYTTEDTLEILKREFGRNICQNTQGWWFDQHIGGGRYKDKEIYKLFSVQENIAHEAYEKNRRKNSEIAFIYDEESYHVISLESTHQMIELFRNYEIDIIGAPSDRYFHNDLSNPDMPDYKLYVFVNTLYLTDSERESIKTKLRKNNATALFMYGSGVINPDRDEPFSPKNITDLTGIEVKENPDVVSGKFKFSENCPSIITDGLDKYDIHGDFKRKMWANTASYMNTIKNSRVNLYPELYSIDKEAENIAYLLENGHPALSVKKNDGFTAIYCATKYLSNDVIRGIAKYSGCHIYTLGDDVLYANESYVTIHAATSGKKIICLPKAASAYELYEQKYYSNNSKKIEPEMKKGETKMFRLDENV